MKIAQLRAFGPPDQVVECVEVNDLAAPGDDEVVIEIEAAPINPADLLIIEGKYASKPPLPAPLGIEGAGRVAAVGKKVTALRVGDRVVSLARANWAERVLVKETQAIKAPAEADVLQLAMLKVNPATAYLMLTRYVTLAPGDWVIQNAANSGVGTALISLAKAAGFKTVNVVRRESLIATLMARGADVVVVDGDDLGARVAQATGGAAIKLGIDAVAGTATLRLADCLAEGGTVVNYGLLSGEPCMVTPHQVVFKGITLTGFWLAKLMSAMAPAELQALYAGLVGRVADGTLKVDVEATYGLDRVKEALTHAARQGRDGKVLLTPNSVAS